MPQSPPLPQFNRPSEAVVYWTLENLCQEGSGQCRLTIADLARRCRLSITTVKRVISWLHRQDIIRYQPGVNQFQPPLFLLSTAQNARCAQLAQLKNGRPKNGRPISNDNDSDNDSLNNFIMNDKDDNVIGKDWPTKNEPATRLSESQDRLAHRIAEGLDDMKNLALYRTYCRRYPEDLLLKAYANAREPSPDKIRVSRGALFNFLVQLYAKKRRE